MERKGEVEKSEKAAFPFPFLGILISLLFASAPTKDPPALPRLSTE